MRVLTVAELDRGIQVWWGGGEGGGGEAKSLRHWLAGKAGPVASIVKVPLRSWNFSTTELHMHAIDCKLQLLIRDILFQTVS